ncbi:MAG: hypothetical protein JJ992_14500 [Planctomycetes bacterium]|nr:hypothetical protein [Planctomycetota bacterium]
MDGHELALLIDERWSTLRELKEISARQMEAIRGCRMSELMRLLSDKQLPLQRLTALAEKTRAAQGDEPNQRRWESEAQRQRCRRRQEECEQMHLELLAIEAECESVLQQSRNDLQQRLQRVDAGRAAANGYARSEHAVTSGERLDLSSS